MKAAVNRPPSASGSSPRPPNPPSLIEYKNMRFLIFDAPSDQNLDFYIRVETLAFFFESERAIIV